MAIFSELSLQPTIFGEGDGTHEYTSFISCYRLLQFIGQTRPKLFTNSTDNNHREIFEHTRFVESHCFFALYDFKGVPKRIHVIYDEKNTGND